MASIPLRVLMMSSRTVGTVCHERPNCPGASRTAFFGAALRQLGPVIFNLLLGVVAYKQRDCLRKLELRAPVEGGKLLAVELERSLHNSALWNRSVSGIVHFIEPP